ncbi:hypothetical protein DAPPUDRAFT_106218 [Daphnia pulex]|uniref:Uncharacterized protein n=1 Tax=Daphnia pulex TaxID=6669 RepID=E9GSX5_DAPPU|nr:hypothetical protein DAPPUDRAFT_106218 [Daphnia pulex]|eukprot:EFX77369.1 hypothetical protein DAPPUDRAFT_106218 [Daphnia pulex]
MVQEDRKALVLGNLVERKPVLSESSVIDEALEELSTKVVSTGNSASQGAATKTVPVKSILNKILPVKSATVKTVSAQITTAKTGLPKPISTELIVTKPVATKIVATSNRNPPSETSAPQELVANTVVTENCIPGVANISVPDKFLAAAMVEIPEGIGSELDTLYFFLRPETAEIETSEQKSDKMDAAPENLAAKTVVTESVAPTNVAKNAAPVPFVRFVAAESIASVNVPPKSDEAISLAAKTDDPKDAVPKILSAKSIEPRTVATRSVATRTKSVNSIETETAEKKGAVKITKPRKEQEIAKESGHNEVHWSEADFKKKKGFFAPYARCN